MRKSQFSRNLLKLLMPDCNDLISEWTRSRTLHKKEEKCREWMLERKLETVNSVLEVYCYECMQFAAHTALSVVECPLMPYS